MIRKISAFAVSCILCLSVFGQSSGLDSLQQHPKVDSIQPEAPNADSILRIVNLNPYFTLHVDSSLSYQLQINKNPDEYFWYLKNSPIGLRINKDNGFLSFKADKAYFLSGRLEL
jgi:hypothetical protein